METITIWMFGGLEIRNASGAPVPITNPKAASLLSFLILNRDRPQTTDTLIEIFWPQHEPVLSRGILRHAFDHISTACADHDIDASTFMTCEDDAFWFQANDSVQIDVDAFDRATGGQTKASLDDDDAADLSSAVALYRGDLLPGEKGPWCEPFREKNRQRFLRAVEGLIDHAIRHHQWSRAILYGTRYLARDPLAEPVHAALMTCFHAAGNRAAAIRQFRHLTDSLRGMLNSEPSDETVALYQEILNDSTRNCSPKNPRAATVSRARPTTGMQPAVPSGLLGSCVWNKS